MRTGLAQTTGLRQELRVNPRLYQAMDMLYMPMMDLQQHLKQELLSNPFLELLEPEEEQQEEKTAEQKKEETQKDDEVDWEEIRELVVESYCRLAPQKLVRLVDRPSAGPGR